MAGGPLEVLRRGARAEPPPGTRRTGRSGGQRSWRGARDLAQRPRSPAHPRSRASKQRRVGASRPRATAGRPFPTCSSRNLSYALTVRCFVSASSASVSLNGTSRGRVVHGVEAKIAGGTPVALPVPHGHLRVGGALRSSDAHGIVLPGRLPPADLRQLERRLRSLRLLDQVREPTFLQVLLELGDHDEPDRGERRGRDHKEKERDLLAERAQARS